MASTSICPKCSTTSTAKTNCVNGQIYSNTFRARYSRAPPTSTSEAGRPSTTSLIEAKGVRSDACNPAHFHTTLQLYRSKSAAAQCVEVNGRLFLGLRQRSPDDRPDRRRSLIGRLRPDIQQYFTEESLNTSCKSAISSIYHDTVRTAIESSSSKLLNGRPPHIATVRKILPWKTRSILSQLRTGHSRILGQYINSTDPTAQNHCHNCGHLPHDTHHLFVCPSKPSILKVELSWTAPTKAVKHLNLVIDETS